MSRSYWRGPLAVEVRNGAVVSQELGSWTSVFTCLNDTFKSGPARASSREFFCRHETELG